MGSERVQEAGVSGEEEIDFEADMHDILVQTTQRINAERADMPAEQATRIPANNTTRSMYESGLQNMANLRAELKQAEEEKAYWIARVADLEQAERALEIFNEHVNPDAPQPARVISNSKT